jgi:hypothetical protein
MKKINITCDTCHITHSVNRTKEIPDNVISMGCNWCPNCEEKAQDYYEEWYNYNDDGDNNKPDPIPDNQLCLPFELNSILNKKDVLQHTF